MRIIKFLFGIFLFVSLISSVLLLTTGTSSAQRACQLTIAKQAEGAGDLEFEFVVVSDQGEDGTIFTLVDGESFSGPISPGASGTITENPPPGWMLDSVVCEDATGLVITEIEAGIEAECVDPSEEIAVCTFVNVRVVSNIPTLSEWGIIAAAAGLVLIGFLGMRRRIVGA